MLQNFGFGEIMIILVIVLLLFGAKRIPEIAGSLGKGINEFKRNVSDAQRQITEPAPRQDNVESRSATEVRHNDDVPEPKRLMN